jgi:predicted nucleotidyltransferase
MPRSVIRKQSYGTVKVFWLDRSLLKSRIMQAARSLSREHEEVVQVVLFGSVASDRAVPSSDADILVVVRDSDTPFLDRSSLFRGYFSDIGVGVDLFVYTQQEVASSRIPVAIAALRTGIELYKAV